MAEQGNEGAMVAAGAVGLQLNPPKAEASADVEHIGTTARVQFDGDSLSVKVTAACQYAGRSLTASIDLDESNEPGLAPLRAAMESIITAYGSQAKQKALDGAYEARQLARHRGELDVDSTSEEVS